MASTNSLRSVRRVPSGSRRSRRGRRRSVRRASGRCRRWRGGRLRPVGVDRSWVFFSARAAQSGLVLLYSWWVTCSPQVVPVPGSSPVSNMARCSMKSSGVRRASVLHRVGCRRSVRGWTAMMSPPRDCIRAMPWVTCRVCPLAWLCQAVRALRANRTSPATMRWFSCWAWR